VARKGFEDLAGWTLEQADLMLEPERNQFAIFRVNPNGEIQVEMCFVGKDEPHDLERLPSRVLLPGFVPSD
jgi:hypothetical protein